MVALKPLTRQKTTHSQCYRQGSHEGLVGCRVEDASKHASHIPTPSKIAIDLYSETQLLCFNSQDSNTHPVRYPCICQQPCRVDEIAFHDKVAQKRTGDDARNSEGIRNGVDILVELYPGTRGRWLWTIWFALHSWWRRRQRRYELETGSRMARRQ